ncbi:MAG: relaxase domain-containing protein [Actinobacteria bacterium]|nr:relaxase domain-containing protein [Actinomycetota bacterium]
MANILNIGKLRKGGELYYLNSVARGVEDYYTNSGEAPGYWVSSGAMNLKLKGQVDEEQLRAVLNGFHPATGERLMNGKPTKRERVPGFDLTFRAPKSVALLHALGGREASNEVVSAHDAAVAAALAYMERQASDARRGKGGKNRIRSEGFVGAAFRHRTSRAGDPLLHTHVLVANMLKGEDGRWGALDARQLYVHAKTAGYLYQAHLRAELTRRLGVAWTPVRRGSADLEGVSREVIRTFSKRRTEIETVVGRADETSARAAQVAAVTSRKAKDYRITPNDLLPEWKERAERLGLDATALSEVLGRGAYRSPTGSEQRLIEAELAGATGLTAQASTFTRREAIQGFCCQLPSGATVEDIERLADAFLVSERVIPLAVRSEGLTAKDSLRVSDGRVIPAGVQERRYSTEEMLAVEQRVIERAIERRLEGSGVATPEGMAAALARRPSLYADQRAMVGRLTTSGQGVEVVVGKAGSGKTFALDAAREAWEESGHRVIGCSLSARAAEELQLGSGIQSYTVTGLLKDLEQPPTGGLASGSVVVVDEAAMVGTRSLDRLLEHAELARAKVVLVGDDRQLPEIEAGGAFRGIKNRLPAIELSEVRRQPFGWERDALDLIRQGRARDAIDAYVAHDRVVIAQSSEETRKRLIQDWWASQGDKEPAVMIAARRSDVADLNDRARSLMTAAGKLGESSLEVDGRSFARGDRVMTLKNSRGLNVKNGTRGIVESVDLEGNEIAMRREDGSTVTLPRSYLGEGHLTHAYAMTGHKAQGMTTDKALVLADQTLYREWTYVAMSRGRNDNRLYVVAGIDPDREELGGQVAGIEDPMKELVAAVGRSRAKDLALDSYEHEEIRSMTMKQLRLEWDKTRSILDSMPRSVAGEAAQLESERRQLEQLLRRQAHIARSIDKKLDGMGPLKRWRDRAEVRGSQRRVADAMGGAREVEMGLRQVARREEQVAALHARRESWLLENAPSIRRLDALGRELWWREQQQALAAEVSMPQYLTQAVGERPLKPSERAVWHEAVRAIERYRERWGVTDRERALGKLDESLDQEQERGRAEVHIENLTRSSHDREVEVRERSIEL